jgi:hypothetical protein
MENQFHVEFVRNALNRMDEKDRDFRFYAGTDLNKKNTN